MEYGPSVRWLTDQEGGLGRSGPPLSVWRTVSLRHLRWRAPTPLLLRIGARRPAWSYGTRPVSTNSMTQSAPTAEHSRWHRTTPTHTTTSARPSLRAASLARPAGTGWPTLSKTLRVAGPARSSLGWRRFPKRAALVHARSRRPVFGSACANESQGVRAARPRGAAQIEPGPNSSTFELRAEPLGLRATPWA